MLNSVKTQSDCRSLSDSHLHKIKRASTLSSKLDKCEPGENGTVDNVAVMAPAFASAIPPRTRAATMSTPAVRLAARARLAEGRQTRKRRKTEHTPATPTTPELVLQAEKRMSDKLQALKFTGAVTHVYNPLVYAWEAHEWYINEYCKSRKEILLVGMNPGPWGMAQTGVPFGEVNAVKHWLKMPESIKIGKPDKENERRPVLGLACTRSEVSGRRLWLEWAKETHDGSVERFFDRYHVHNYCPLMFLQASGKNLTPAQLRALERVHLVEVCDVALREVVEAVKPKLVCGVGGFATERCKVALKEHVERGLLIGTILHPSPASPLANKGWASKAEQSMQDMLQRISGVEDIWAPNAKK